MKKKIYIRDGRAPIPEKELTSKIMSKIKGRNTKPEMILRKSLFHNGFSGYRIHWRKVPGRPDICYPGKKIAIFVNGCFWHRCPKCNLPLPKSNAEFWQNKFSRNEERDEMKTNRLTELGWEVITIWECEIKKDVNTCIEKIKKYFI